MVFAQALRIDGICPHKGKYPLRTQSPPRGLQKPAPFDWSIKQSSQSKTAFGIGFFVIGWCSHIDQSQGTGLKKTRGGLCVLAG